MKPACRNRNHYVACCVIITAVLMLGSSVRADVLIDSFLTSQSAAGTVDTRNTADGLGILGGERDIRSHLSLSANGTISNQLRVAFPNPTSLTGLLGAHITYDGNDNNASGSSFAGLGSLDLTQGGVNDRFRLNVTAVSSLSAFMEIEVRQVFRGSIVQVSLPQTPGIWDIPFASFQTLPFINVTNAVDFTAVGYINFSFVMSQGESIAIDGIITTIPEPSTASLVIGFGLWFVSRSPRKQRA